MKKRVIGWSAVGVVFFTGFYYLSFLRESGRPISLALEMARESPAVTESLGGTNLKGEFVTGRLISGADYGNADLHHTCCRPNSTRDAFGVGAKRLSRVAYLFSHLSNRTAEARCCSCR